MGDDTRFSLGELARAAAMTTRNVRAYQTRGLIPPPLRVGRRSEYTTHHLERLRAIHRARAQGATLALISDHLSRGDTIDLTRLPAAVHEWLPVQRPAGDGPDDGTGRPTAPGSLPVGVPVSPHDLDPLDEQPTGARLLRPRRGDGVPPTQRSADLSPLLDRTHAAEDPAVLAIVDGLVDAGVVVRDCRRIVAGPGLVAALTALHRHGLPLELCLGVALRAARGAAELAGPLGTALTSGPAPGAPEVVDLVADLAAGVLRGVLLDQLVEAAQARR